MYVVRTQRRKIFDTSQSTLPGQVCLPEAISVAAARQTEWLQRPILANANAHSSSGMTSWHVAVENYILHKHILYRPTCWYWCFGDSCPWSWPQHASLQRPQCCLSRIKSINNSKEIESKSCFSDLIFDMDAIVAPSLGRKVRSAALWVEPWPELIFHRTRTASDPPEQRLRQSGDKLKLVTTTPLVNT